MVCRFPERGSEIVPPSTLRTGQEDSTPVLHPLGFCLQTRKSGGQRGPTPGCNIFGERCSLVLIPSIRSGLDSSGMRVCGPGRATGLLARECDAGLGSEVPREEATSGAGTRMAPSLLQAICPPTPDFFQEAGRLWAFPFLLHHPLTLVYPTSSFYFFLNFID